MDLVERVKEASVVVVARSLIRLLRFLRRLGLLFVVDLLPSRFEVSSVSVTYQMASPLISPCCQDVQRLPSD